MASARISPWAWQLRTLLCAATCGVAAAQAAAQPAYQVADIGHVTENAATPPDGERGAVPTAPAAPARARMRPGVLPALGALVPGLAVHGTGHFIGGDARTGRRLMLAQGIGLATAAAGAVPLALTGASDDVSTFSLPLVVAGTGMFMLGWAADVYGSAGGPRLAGAPAPALPGSEVGLGYLYVRDPRFDYTSFVDMDALVRAGAWRVEGAAALAVDDDNQRVRLRAGYRFLGPRPARRAASGTALDFVTAVTVHRYGTDGFTTVTPEVSAHGRLDLSQISPSLAGAFVEGDLGLGLDRAAYRHAPADTVGILVGRFGFGMYLGQPTASHGELQLYYDHRRDGLVGGLATRRFNGILGSVGVQGALTVRRGMGVAVQAQAGSAVLVGIGLRYTRP